MTREAFTPRGFGGSPLLLARWSEAGKLVEPIQNDYDMPVAAADVIA